MIVPLRILIVEDEPLMQWSLSEVLSEAGHLVVQAVDARSALSELAVRSGSFDLVLLDVRLPDCQDVSLLRRFRRLAPALVVVVMTAHGTPELTAECLRLGASEVMDKPFDMASLEPALLRAYGARACTPS